MIHEKVFKPIINELIRYYYGFHSAGGHLHIATDDGNLDDSDVFFCQEKCEENNDELGYLIATTLRLFSEKERYAMYSKDRWGMKID